MSTIRKDVEAETQPFDAADALLGRWQDAGQLSNPEDEEGDSHQSETDDGDEDETDQTEENVEDQEDQDESSDEGDDDETDDDGDEDEESSDDDDDDEDEDDGSEKLLENLDTKVKIKIGDEERTVSVKDLTRLYGQEAALTKKSQEVSELRKKTEDEGTRYVAASEAMLKRA